LLTPKAVKVVKISDKAAKQKLGISGIFGNSQKNPDSYIGIIY